MRYFIAACVSFYSVTACAEMLPSTAKKVTPGELRALSDKKAVTVDIFDLGKPIRGRLVWDWQGKVITGTAVISKAQKIKVRSVLSVAGDKVCTANKGDQPSCHTVYIDGNKFFEVNDDGSLHAVSAID